MKNIAKRETIVELLGYLHNPDKETVITPANVANLPYEKLVFDWSAEGIKQSTFYDINIKSGIFPFLAAYNLGKANPDTQWKTIIRRSIFGNMRTKTAKYITLRILGLKRNSVEAENFTVIDINRIRLLIPKWNKLPEKEQPNDWSEITDSHEFISTLLMLSNKGFLRGKGAHLEHPTWIKLHETVDEFVASVNQGSDVEEVKETLAKLVRLIVPEKDSNPLWKEFRFDYLVSNPPYQVGYYQLYTDFYLVARKIANNVSMIFPEGWQRGTNGNGLEQMNTPEIKEDPQIVMIDNCGNTLFNAATTANIIVWKRGSDNGLEGMQRVYRQGDNPAIIKLETGGSHTKEQKDLLSKILSRYQEICRDANDKERYLSDKVSSYRPYYFRTNIFDENIEYVDYSRLSKSKQRNGITILGTEGRSTRKICYADGEYIKQFLKKNIKKREAPTNTIKIFVPKAWGSNQGEYLGGTYSDIVLGAKNEICTETFVEVYTSGIKQQRRLAKYILTRHFRFCLYMGKDPESRMVAKNAWRYVPDLNLSEEWWDTDSVEEIENRLNIIFGLSPKEIGIINKTQKLSEGNIKTILDYPIVDCDFDSWK